jgi:transposase, IS5 family
MNQANLGLDLTTKRTRMREIFDEMNRVVPRGELVALAARHAPEGKRGRPPFPVEVILRTRFMQQWFTLSDLNVFGDLPIRLRRPTNFECAEQSR